VFEAERRNGGVWWMATSVWCEVCISLRVRFRENSWCMVTDIGAIPERAGRAAIRVPPGDADALARAMGDVLARPSSCAELRAHIAPLGASPDAHVERVLAHYAAAIAAPPADRSLAVPAWRRAQLVMLQRESAQARIGPEGGPR
jgi:hypothetical protein